MHKGTEVEAAFTKNGTWPDPESTMIPEFKSVQESVKDSFFLDATRLCGGFGSLFRGDCCGEGHSRDASRLTRLGRDGELHVVARSLYVACDGGLVGSRVCLSRLRFGIDTKHFELCRHTTVGIVLVAIRLRPVSVRLAKLSEVADSERWHRKDSHMPLFKKKHIHACMHWGGWAACCGERAIGGRARKKLAVLSCAVRVSCRLLCLAKLRVSQCYHWVRQGKILICSSLGWKSQTLQWNLHEVTG